MKFGIFAIYDTKAAAHLPPFFLPTRGLAIRAFTDCVNDSTHQFSKHPEDYTLFLVGNFDDVSGEIDMPNVRENLGHGSQFVVQSVIEE